MTQNRDEKSFNIHFRVNQKEYEIIKNNSAKSGLSVSEYARKTLTGKKIVTAPPIDFYEMIREIKRVGSNLNQLLRKLNILGTVHPLELERCAEELQRLIDAMYQTFRPTKGED